MIQKEVTYHVHAFVVFLIILFTCPAQAQSLSERHQRLRALIESGDYGAAKADLQSLSKTEPATFALNNYDYLLARISERRGERATAAANYERVMARNSLLSQYALWHLAQIARSTGDLGRVGRQQCLPPFGVAAQEHLEREPVPGGMLWRDGVPAKMFDRNARLVPGGLKAHPNLRLLLGPEAGLTPIERELGGWLPDRDSADLEHAAVGLRLDEPPA